MSPWARCYSAASPIGDSQTDSKEEPAYDRLLAQVAPSPTERRALLAHYFEPSEEERELGLKQPTKAHKAIAALVAKGFIRVLVTTNFDRLMERALDEAGVPPTVIASPDAIAGAPALPHSRCVLIKVHGDYHDLRIKNSPEELATYDPALTRFLSRIADDYGLIICGWSGDYDTALRETLAGAGAGQRYPVYWCAKGTPGATGAAFIAAAQARTITISDADSFFVALREKVEALETMAHGRPMTAAAAAATAKRYAADAAGTIRLHDLVVEEARRAAQELRQPDLQEAHTSSIDPNEFVRRTDAFERATETLAALFVVGTYWGAGERPLRNAFELMGNLPGPDSGGTFWIDWRTYPALLLYYATGVTSVLKGSFGLFAMLTNTPVAGRRTQAWRKLHAQSPVNSDAGRMWPGFERHHTPVSDRLLEYLRPHLLEYAADKVALERAFDLFEFLNAMIYNDGRSHPGTTVASSAGHDWAPVGAFKWRSWSDIPETTDYSVDTAVWQEIVAAGAQWPPLQAGLFAGDLERAKAAFARVGGFCARVHFN